jgi:hypothetical protein
MTDAVCPRCGHANKFRVGRLPQTCVCMVCESQLDWRNIPGCGPDCRPLPDEEKPELAEVPMAVKLESPGAAVELPPGAAEVPAGAAVEPAQSDDEAL